MCSFYSRMRHGIAASLTRVAQGDSDAAWPSRSRNPEASFRDDVTQSPPKTAIGGCGLFKFAASHEGDR